MGVYHIFNVVNTHIARLGVFFYMQHIFQAYHLDNIILLHALLILSSIKRRYQRIHQIKTDIVIF